MNKLSKIGRRNTDSPIDGIKELVERAATPLRLVRKKFTPSTSSDAGRLQIQPTDENLGGSVQGKRCMDQCHAVSSIECEAAQSDSRSALDAQPLHMEQATPDQSSNSLHQSDNNFKERYQTPHPLSPDQNQVFTFPSKSQSSDMLSPQHERTTFHPPRSINSYVAETGDNSDPAENSNTKNHQLQIPTHLQNRDTSNGALERTNDKIDEDKLSAWWFLGSRSDESIECSPQITNKNNKDPTIAIIDSDIRAQCSDDDHRKAMNRGSSIASKPSRAGSISTWIFQSFSSDKTHSLRVKGANSLSSGNIELLQKSSKSESKSLSESKSTQGVVKKVRSFVSDQHPKGGNYTRKEAAKRREWLVGLGGTVNYDQPYDRDCESVASYQLYPNQKDNLQINTSLSIREDSNKSPDWDPSMLPKQKSPTFNDWTPQDSSYGAAVAACGWIPKRIRKLIEMIFFLVVSALIIFLVVKLGIQLTTGKEHKSSSGTDLDLWNDDDHYIANEANNHANMDDVIATDDRLYNGSNRRLLRLNV